MKNDLVNTALEKCMHMDTLCCLKYYAMSSNGEDATTASKVHIQC